MKKREDMIKKVLMILLGFGLVAGLSLPALAVGEVELYKLTASDAASGDYFGGSVALSDTTALVGAFIDNATAGSAYMFCVFPPVGDNNRDCRVDLRDFALMAGNWLVNCLVDPSDPACQAP